ncbi:hypothetical protein, partial [Cryptosporangium minutisporangium]|uniref:hypothetical protein n=1 Tax=Cryptosporangium minutisporangium TaxID=113569 RepID=UPI0035E6CF3F
MVGSSVLPFERAWLQAAVALCGKGASPPTAGDTGASASEPPVIWLASSAVGGSDSSLREDAGRAPGASGTRGGDQELLLPLLPLLPLRGAAAVRDRNHSDSIASKIGSGISIVGSEFGGSDGPARKTFCAPVVLDRSAAASRRSAAIASSAEPP